jgi:putative DNA primase/helicase
MIKFDQIPKVLTSYAQWALWKYENKTKVPYFANGSGQRASSTDKSTWRSFQFARQAFQENDDSIHYDGIFFVLSKDDPFTVIDLDHCIVDGVLNIRAFEEIEKWNSYTEISPSGTGLHIWICATLPVDIKHRADDVMEIYDHSRFMSVTGMAISDKMETF